MFQQMIVVGNVGGEVTTRKTGSGLSVASFSVATNRRYTKPDGTKEDKVTWFRCTGWGKDAEILSQYVVKGMTIMCVGELQEPNVYQAKDGTAKASLELNIRTFKFLSKSTGESGHAPEPVAADGWVAGGGDIPF